MLDVLLSRSSLRADCDMLDVLFPGADPHAATERTSATAPTLREVLMVLGEYRALTVKAPVYLPVVESASRVRGPCSALDMSEGEAGNERAPPRGPARACT